MHALLADARLSSAPPERWRRAQSLRERRWLRDVRVQGDVATAACAGLVGVRVRLDRASGQGACTCAQAQPCEHALALALEVGLAALPPPPPPPPVACLLVALHPDDPGALRLADTRGGHVAPPVAEALRWLWWTRAGDGSLRGEARTLPQALQLLADKGHDARGAAQPGPFAARAVFRQKALGDPVAVRFEEPTSDASLALAKLLADKGAKPFPAPPPYDTWWIDEARFASWWLAAWAAGSEARPDPTLDPRALHRVEVEIDPGCLPARVRAPLEAADVVRALVARESGEALVEDAEHGHLLVPAARIVAVEDGLRAMGADVRYHRLAPAGQRFLEWRAELPEDVRGARPRLREPWRGGLAREVPGLRPGVELAPYQREAVAFILHHDHTCLLADDMGLGKTLEAIAAAQCVEGRVLVVAPASAREVWRHEVEKFTTERAVVVGPGATEVPAEGRFVVTGYSNLEALGDALRPEGFALVVLDESHYVKNAASGRARLVREKLQRVERRLVISGTPVMNTPEEIRAQLAFLHPDEWSDVAWFRKRFEEPFDEGTPEVRAQVLARLRQFLDGVMLRREKSEALPDLPPKRIEWHRAKLSGEARRAYVALEDELAAALERGEAATSGGIERLKQAAVAGKMPAAVSFVRGLVAGGEKVVVFSRYRNVIASLARELADAGPVVLTGDSSPEERADAERRFQSDDACRVFVGQLVAAGTALTLTAGTHVVFLDLDWNPANHRQAMDRIHRRGQTRPCAAHFFLAEDTVDEDVARVLDEKGRMMDALLGSASAAGVKGATRLVGERLLERRSSAPVATT